MALTNRPPSKSPSQVTSWKISPKRIKSYFLSMINALTLLCVLTFRTVESHSLRYVLFYDRNTKKETSCQTRRTFQMMIYHSAPSQDAKSLPKILGLEKRRRKRKTTKTKRCRLLFGSLPGFSNKKTLTRNKISKRRYSTKSIRISKPGRNLTHRPYKKYKNKYTKGKSHRSSLCFTFHCVKVHWRKKRNVTIFWQSFIRNAFLIKSLSRTHQSIWAIRSWSWKLMIVCTLGSLELRYWRVAWLTESSFRRSWSTIWYVTSLQSQSLSRISQVKTSQKLTYRHKTKRRSSLCTIHQQTTSQQNW